MSLIGTGLYPLRQAAQLVGADPRAVRRWMMGYERKTHGERRFSPPLWSTQLADEGLQQAVIGFHDLLELRLVSAFVQHGVSLPVIRATADAARHQFGTAYPLTAQRFLTDGKSIFLEAVENSGETKLLDMPRRQFVFAEVVKPSLYAAVEYEGLNARRWFPLGPERKIIVLDPAVQFGAPVVAGTGIPTDTLYASFLAEGRDRKTVARIYDVTPRMVDAAVRFEEKLAA